MEQCVLTEQDSAAHPLRLYVVEDSPRIIEHLIAMFDSIEGVLTVGCSTSAEEAIRGIRAANPEVVLLDVQLARGSGFSVLRAIHAFAPQIDVFMLSNFAAEPYRRLAKKLGARGFFDKSTEFEQMRQMILARARRRHDNPRQDDPSLP